MMSEPNRIDDLEALHALVDEALILVSSMKTSDGRSERATEVLTSALALSADLVAHPPSGNAARMGGLKTAERGPEFYREISAKRKTKAGGRPKG